MRAKPDVAARAGDFLVALPLVLFFLAALRLGVVFSALLSRSRSEPLLELSPSPIEANSSRSLVRGVTGVATTDSASEPAPGAGEGVRENVTMVCGV